MKCFWNDVLRHPYQDPLALETIGSTCKKNHKPSGLKLNIAFLMISIVLYFISSIHQSWKFITSMLQPILDLLVHFMYMYIFLAIFF